jgi:dolichol-phosphate mannosyltransferase
MSPESAVHPPLEQQAVDAASVRTEPARDRTGATSVTVVIPTYNEAEVIERTVSRCREALADYPAEILVVDDDSPDLTWRLVRVSFLADDDVRVIRRTDGKGLATAVSRGIQEAANEVCVVMDADLQHPPEKIPELVDAFDDDVGLVVASRYGEGGIENWSRWRQLVSSGARLVATATLPAARQVSDPLSGFFAVRRDAVSDVELAPVGYKILLEILVRGDYGGVREVPYVFRERERGESKLTAAEYRNFLAHLAALRTSSRG